MGITDMKIGDKAEITGYEETAAGYRLIGVAPMGDPLRFRVRGFELSLRKDEATILKLKEVAE